MKAATLIGAGSRVASNATIASAVPVQAPHARQYATMLVPPCRVQPSPAFTLQSTCQARSRPYSLRRISVHTFAAEADYETEDDVELDFKSGDVVVGVVDGIRPFGAFIKLGDSGANGLLHISQISSEYIDNVDSVLQVGEQVKVLVTRIDRDTNRISLTTRRLERSPGDMINNRQAVWDGAEEMAEQVRSEWAERRAERQARADGDGGFRNRSRRDDGDGGFRGRGGGRGGRGGRGGGRGGYGGERRQRRDFD